MGNHAKHKPGAYLGSLKTVEFGTFKEGGAPFMFIIFNVTHRAEDGDWLDMPSGAEASVGLCLSQASMPYTSKKLQTMGFDQNWDEPGFAPRFYEGNVALTNQHKDNNGNINDEWIIDELKGGGGFKPLDASVMASIKAAYKSTVPPKGAPPAPPKAPAPASQRPAPPANPAKPDDDLPF